MKLIDILKQVIKEGVLSEFLDLEKPSGYEEGNLGNNHGFFTTNISDKNFKISYAIMTGDSLPGSNVPENAEVCEISFSNADGTNHDEMFKDNHGNLDKGAVNKIYSTVYAITMSRIIPELNPEYIAMEASNENDRYYKLYKYMVNRKMPVGYEMFNDNYDLGDSKLIIIKRK